MTFTCPNCRGTNTEQGKDENCDLLWCRDCLDFVVDLVRDTNYIRDIAQVVGTGFWRPEEIVVPKDQVHLLVGRKPGETLVDWAKRCGVTYDLAVPGPMSGGIVHGAQHDLDKIK